MRTGPIPKLLRAHKFERDEHEHYVEPEWCSKRLFEEEFFPGLTWDPSCGWGRIKTDISTDLVYRGHGEPGVDFLKCRVMWGGAQSIVCNPPFDLMREFAEHALELGAYKVAMIAILRRLPAARWLKDTPLKHVWLMTPRPSMPTGRYISEGGKVGGGTQEFCWLVWEHGPREQPVVKWLHRDRKR